MDLLLRRVPHLIGGCSAGKLMGPGSALCKRYSRWLKSRSKSIGPRQVSMVLFPPGKGGGQGVERGYKGKGVLIHSIVDAKGMPLAVCVTSAKASERAQVLPMLDAITIRTGKPGRPRTRPKQLAADKGYDSQELRQELRRRSIQPELPRRIWKDRRQPPGAKLKRRVKRYVVERSFSWYQRKFRRLVVRWERKPDVFQAFVSIGFAWIWFTRLLMG